MLKIKPIATGTAISIRGALGLLPATTASAAPAASPATAGQAAARPLPVKGTLSGGTTFTAALSNLTTAVVNGVVQLSGTITGTRLPAGGTDFTAPIQDLAVTESCTVLNLDLGPLNLEVPGLVIELAPVSLDVTTAPWAGEPRGNLLCAVAGLLDGPGTAPGAHPRSAQPNAYRFGSLSRARH